MEEDCESKLEHYGTSKKIQNNKRNSNYNLRVHLEVASYRTTWKKRKK
jgi:hypothetical protein